MKTNKKESNLPKDILKQINLEVEKEIELEMAALENCLDKMTFDDMEKQVLSIRAKVGQIFMEKVVQAKAELSKKKL